MAPARAAAPVISAASNQPIVVKPQADALPGRPCHTSLQSRIDTPQRQVDQLQAEAQTRWQRARQGAEGRAFVVRLLFVGPLLALAIWQFRRFRGSDQWPAGAPGPDSLRECAAGTGAQPLPQL